MLKGFVALLVAGIWGCGGSQPVSTPQTPGAPIRIEVVPAVAEVGVGQGQAFHANAYDQEGRLVGQTGVAWSSGDPQVVAVDGAGSAVGVGGGNARVLASAGSLDGSALVAVSPIPAFHNGRAIEWYETQMGTGASANNNCGPTSTQMAIRWHRNATSGIPTVGEIRARHPRDGGWWFTGDISESLAFYGVPFAVHAATGAEGDSIEAVLRRGRIALLCVEMKWVSYDRGPFYDRFYQFDSGHFLIVKGLSEDGQYFVVYDSNSWGSDHDAIGVAMGRNRYYRTSEVRRAVANWWPYVFEIGASVSTSSIREKAVPEGFAGPR